MRVIGVSIERKVSLWSEGGGRWQAPGGWGEEGAPFVSDVAGTGSSGPGRIISF